MVLFILLFYLSKCSFLEFFAIIELTGLLGDEIILGKQKNVSLFLLDAGNIESPLAHESFVIIHD